MEHVNGESKAKRLGLDAILDAVHEIASDPNAGPDRFRAIKLITSLSGSSVTLPPPMTEAEAAERLARLMRAFGRQSAQVAYAKAFGKRAPVIENAPDYKEDNFTKEQLDFCRSIRTVRQMYKAFPEAKRPGTPPGYPKGKSMVAQQAWVFRAVKRLLLDRINEGKTLPLYMDKKRAFNPYQVKNDEEDVDRDPTIDDSPGVEEA